MRILSKFLAAGLIAATLFSCGGSKDVAEAELTGFIPSEAKAVISVNLTSLKTKAGSIDRVFEGSSDEEELKQIFESAAYVYFTVLQKQDGGISVLSLARLSESTALKKKLGEVTKTLNGVEVFSLKHKVKNLTTTTLENSDETEMKVIETEEVYGYAAVKNNIVMTLTSPNMKAIDEKVIDQLVGYFTASETNLLASEPTFVDALAKKKDFTLWMSGAFETNEETLKLIPRQYKSFLQNVNLDGAYSSATLDFEKGAIVADYFFKGNEEYVQKYAGLVKEKLESSTVDQFKIAEPALLFTSAFNPEKTLALIKENGTDKQIDQTISSDELGISTEDLFAMINGDVLISAGNINIEGQPDADIEIVIGLKDEEKAKNLLDLLVAKGQLQATDDYYSQNIMGMVPVAIVVREQTMIITKDNAFGQTLVKGEGTVNSTLADKVKANSSLLFVNPSHIPYQALVGFGVLSAEEAAHLDQIETIEMSGKQNADGKSTGVLELKLKNKDINSLQLINEVVSQ